MKPIIFFTIYDDRITIKEIISGKYVWLYEEGLHLLCNDKDSFFKAIAVLSPAKHDHIFEKFRVFINQTKFANYLLGEITEVHTESPKNIFEQHMETSLEKLKLAISHEEAYFKKSSLFNLKDIYIADYNDTSIFNLETDNSDEKDRKYRNKYLLLLLKTFENCCARCKISDKGIHLDHFMIPRSMNGTFILETKTGFKLHNAIPLCESCNTSKGDKDYRIFFNNEELKEIIEKFSTLPNLND